MRETDGERSDEEVSLMFSGGIDSTTAAFMLSKRYRHVHLLTYSNGYGHYRIDRTSRRADELRRVCGDRFSHTILPVRELFEELLVSRLRDEYRRWGSAFVWCLGCKLAMHAHSVVYNLEHGIRNMADGSSRSTGEMVEQMLVSVYMVREFYARFGIDYRTPVYDVPRGDEIAFLRAAGFRMGVRVGDRFLGVQPKCRPGELYYAAFLLFNQPPGHDEERIAAFIEEKCAVMDAWVRARVPGAAADAADAGK
ncbi:MAG: 7-cyano-7-deazaguanine synthase [Deltaproteobacteria bacterium]|nr:7-cyano-7-deazaguanine synthase [Deltaproteobacteria bacterium]